jgi:hypothetical protein
VAFNFHSEFLTILEFRYGYLIRMRDSYKRFVKTWIRFANPWIRIVS